MRTTAPMLRSRAVAVVMRTSTRALMALAIAIAAPWSSAVAAPKRRPDTELERSQAFVGEGDHALERGDYEEAIAKYRAAYYGLGPEVRASYMGSIPIRKAMEAYDLLAAREQGRNILDQQLGLVTEFLQSVYDQPDGVARVGQAVVHDLEAVRSAIEQKLAALAAAAAPSVAEEPPAQPEPEPEPEPPAVTPPPEISPRIEEQLPPASDDTPSSTRKKLGLGLAVGGGAVLGTGACMLAGWWTVRNQAERFADEEPGYEIGTPARQQYLAREEERAQRYLIAGAVVMGVGAATTITGIVLLAKDRRRAKQTQLTITPRLDLDHAGLVIRGRF